VITVHSALARVWRIRRQTTRPTGFAAQQQADWVVASGSRGSHPDEFENLVMI
jgi:hypothetical protein